MKRRTKNVAVSMPRTNLSIKADDDPLLELSDFFEQIGAGKNGDKFRLSLMKTVSGILITVVSKKVTN